MKSKMKKYAGLVVFLALIIIAVSVYVRSTRHDLPSPEDKEAQNRKLLDSLNRINKELIGVILQQQKEEAEAYNKFKKETERLKKEYDEKINRLSNLSIDEHIEFLASELSKED